MKVIQKTNRLSQNQHHLSDSRSHNLYGCQKSPSKDIRIEFKGIFLENEFRIRDGSVPAHGIPSRLPYPTPLLQFLLMKHLSHGLVRL